MKKIALLGVALVLALALCGAGYAYWTDSVTVNMEVSTGTIGGELVDPMSNDPSGANDPGQDIDVACTEVSPVSEGGKSFTVTVSNGYAGYSSQVDFAIENTGTIPEKISAITIADTSIAKAGDYVDVDLDGDGVNDVRVTPGKIYIDQLIECDTAQDATLEMYVCQEGVEEQDATQGVSGQFTMTIDLIQWNAPLED